MRADNLSTMFMLPAIQLGKGITSRFSNSGFINCYLFCEQLTMNYGYETLFLLFKPKRFDLVFYNLTLDMEKNPHYVETIDIPGGIVVVYRIPKKFVQEYN